MERKDFLLKSALLGSMGLFAAGLSGTASAEQIETIEPVLLEPLPPLEHNGGLNIRTRIRSKMTNSVYSNVECAVAPKTMGPPPHYHKELDELMYVTEGTASVLVAGTVVEVKAGGWHLRPRNILHTFWNATDQPLRFIDMYFNQPFEEYLERIFFELTEKNGFKEGSPEKIKEIDLLNKKFGVVFPENAFSEYEKIKLKYKLK